MSETAQQAPAQRVEMTAAEFSAQIDAVTVPLIQCEVTQKFDAILGNVVRRQLGEGQAAQSALSSGSFVLNELTVVLRLNEDNDAIELYADMGLPDTSADQVEIFGTLLQMNLHNTYPGIVFGRNEASKRLVAFLKGHIFMMDDEGDFCLACLHKLTGTVHEIRNW
ncbi:hypothetical protein BH11PSE7_BH11PSE7_23280 [soil metagenome]